MALEKFCGILIDKSKLIAVSRASLVYIVDESYNESHHLTLHFDNGKSLLLRTYYSDDLQGFTITAEGKLSVVNELNRVFGTDYSTYYDIPETVCDEYNNLVSNVIKNPYYSDVDFL